MTLRQRLARLEEAAPQGDDDALVVLWRSILRPCAEGWDDDVRHAHILGGPNGPGETLERRPGESEAIFVRHVLQRAAIIHDRPDPAFAEALRWRPRPIRTPPS